MNQQVFFLGLLQLILSLLFGVVILYLNYRILYRYVASKYNVNESNLAFAILGSSILFSVGFLMSEIIQPIITTLRLLEGQTGGQGGVLADSVKYILTFLTIGMLVSLVINLSSVLFYTALTRVKEFEEIAKNNIAVGLVTGVIVITMTLLARDGMVLIIESFIPYPEIPNVF